MSTAKLWPKRIDENSCSTITYFLNQAASVGIISLEYQFVSLWLHVLDVTVDYLFCTRLTEVNYRHENHLVENIAVFCLYRLVRKFSLDDALVNCTSLLQNLHGIIEVVVTLVNIHHDFALAEFHYLTESWNLMAGLAAYTILQAEHLQRIKSIILWESLTIHGSVNLLIVHQNQNAILCLLQVQLNHINTHVDTVLECLNRIFRSITPVSTMRNDHNIFFCRLIEILKNLFQITLCKAHRSEHAQQG